jgi:hypothetical protein
MILLRKHQFSLWLLGLLVLATTFNVVPFVYAEEEDDDDDRVIGRPDLETFSPSHAPTSPPVDFQISISSAPSVGATASPSAAPTAKLETTESPTMKPSSTTAPEKTNSPSSLPTLTPSSQPSSEPSAVGTLAPSTTTPTLSPSKAPSRKQPTTGPTPAPFVDSTPAPVGDSSTDSPTVAGTDVIVPPDDVVPSVALVEMELRSTSTLLIGQTRILFLAVTQSFLQKHLRNILDPSTVQVQLVGQSLLQGRRRQLRSLQENDNDVGRLKLDLSITADAQPSSNDNWFQLQVILAFLEHEAEFLQALQDTGDAYFNSIESTIVAVAEPSSTLAPTPAPVSFPWPDNESPTTDDDTKAQDNNENDLFLPLGVLIGIGVAGGAVLLLMCAFCMKRKLKAKRTTTGEEGASFTSESSPAVVGSEIRTSSLPLQYSRSKSRDDDRTDAASEIVENQTLYSYVDNTSFIPSGDADTLAGADTMSYAYSLEAGFEASVMSGTSQEQGGGRGVPTEIGKPASPTLPPINITTSTRASSRTSSKPPVELAPNLSLATSDLELTQSELAMLPSNLRDDDEETGLEELPSRVVYAPAGKLGMVVDTTVEGPVVHSVNKTSALRGKLFPGDVIIAIDGVNTRAMSAEDISKLMIKTVNKRRKLTVVTGGSL